LLFGSKSPNKTLGVPDADGLQLGHGQTNLFQILELAQTEVGFSAAVARL
jgi:hypothetical protein